MSFSEKVPNDGENIAGYCYVEADEQFDFVTIVTDDYEGSAMVNLPTAKNLIPVLQRAIAYLETMKQKKL